MTSDLSNWWRPSIPSPPVCVAFPEISENPTIVMKVDDFIALGKEVLNDGKGLHKWGKFAKKMDHLARVAKEFGLSHFKIRGPYIIFKGNPKYRKVLRSTRYLQSNAKILKMGIGRMGAAKRLMTGSWVTLVLFGAEGFLDYMAKGQVGIAEFTGKLTIALGKTGTSRLLGYVAAQLAIPAIAAAYSVTIPVVLPVAGGIVFGVLIQLGLDYLDEQYGITTTAAKISGELFEKAKAEYQNFRYKSERWYRQAEKQIEYMLLNPGAYGF